KALVWLLRLATRGAIAFPTPPIQHALVQLMRKAVHNSRDWDNAILTEYGMRTPFHVCDGGSLSVPAQERDERALSICLQVAARPSGERELKAVLYWCNPQMYDPAMQRGAEILEHLTAHYGPKLKDASTGEFMCFETTVEDLVH